MADTHKPRATLDGFVLDAIGWDAEQVPDIVKFLNESDSEWMSRFERPVQQPEVLAALMRLVKDGAVLIRFFDEEANDYVAGPVGIWPEMLYADMYFDLTGRGQVLFLNWDS